MKLIEALESCNKSVIFFNKLRNDSNNASLLNWDKFSVESIDSTINYIKKIVASFILLFSTKNT